MEGFLCEENVERIAHNAFQESADSSAGDDDFAPAELLEDIIRDMGLALDAEQRSRLENVCEHGRISRQQFVGMLRAIRNEHPETQAAYSSLLRRRHLEERAEIEAVFALYDHDGSGAIDVQGSFFECLEEKEAPKEMLLAQSLTGICMSGGGTSCVA